MNVLHEASQRWGPISSQVIMHKPILLAPILHHVAGNVAIQRNPLQTEVATSITLSLSTRVARL